MYANLILWKAADEYKLLLLPYEKRNQFQVKDWLCYLSKGCEYSVTRQPISLAYGDYAVRGWMTGKRSYKNLYTAKASVDQMLHFQSKVCWVDGVVESEMVANNEGKMAALQLALLMSGRKLLYGELQALTTDQVHSEVQQDWRRALQRCIIAGDIVVRSSIQLQRLGNGNRKAQYCCLRCYEQQLEHTSSVCTYCGEGCYYCKECLVMGRSRTCGLLLVGTYCSPLLGAGMEIESKAFHPSRIVHLGRYHLSPAQQKATKAALGYIYKQNKQYLEDQERHIVRGGSKKNDSHRKSTVQAGNSQYRHKSYVESKAILVHQLDQLLGNKLQQLKSWYQRYDRNFLIWAVTGAGKTEMIFPLIEYVTKQGGKVLLATPRRDVVLELDPRLRKAFPELSIVTLYGGSSQRWQEGQLVVATTHQLMRFQQAFELVIIDELDAFPYHGDPRLYRVAAQCSTLGGIRILLSATPPRQLQQAMQAKRLSYVLLPVRYHRHPLPVPTMLITPSIAQQLQKSNIPMILITAMKQSIARGAQLFVFVQRIAEAEPYVALLQRYFPNIVIAATSSKDDSRTEKVQAFRQRHIRMLVTTTILERGVTIPQSDVYICDADGSLFDESSLVQMAGRAGRSADDPKGKVYFSAKHRNEAQLRAVKQITTMNKQARKQKYLLEQYW